MARFAIFLLVALVPALAQAQALVLDEVPEALRAEVGEVSGDATVTARIPAREVTCQEATFSWLLARLPLASKLVRALELGDYGIEQLDNGELRIDDREGARADCVRAIDEPGRLLMIARGLLDVRVLPTIHGTGVILLRWEVSPDDPAKLRCQGKVWFRLRSRLLHLATSPFRRTLRRVLEQKLDDLIRRAIKLAEAVDANPAAVFQTLQRRGEATTAELVAFRDRFLLH
jgi:hypothetical protein